MPRALEACLPHLRDGQMVILRSTVYPGVTALTERLLAKLDADLDVAFCPERIAEGKAMTELFDLPQIVAGRTNRSRRRAEEFFRVLTDEIVTLEPEEAELAKLFTNTWRYIKFATANQFWMMANDFGVDFERIRHAVTWEYPRAADLPGAGFAAGPCLFKDTMQLAAFNKNNFVLGHAAMMINEGLPLYLVSRLENRYELPLMTVGILGMAFKPDSDDPRESLSYKLRRILELKCRHVLAADPHVKDDTPSPARGGSREGRPADHRHPTRGVPPDPRARAGDRHLGRHAATACRYEPTRVSVVVPAYNEGRQIVTTVQRLLDSVQEDCEVLVVYDTPDDSTAPFAEKLAADDPRVRPTVNTYGRGPAHAIRFGLDHARAPVAIVTMADGSDDPTQVDALAALIDRGAVVAAASRYMPGGQQVGGPPMKSLVSRRSAGRCTCSPG